MSAGEASSPEEESCPEAQEDDSCGSETQPLPGPSASGPLRRRRPGSRCDLLTVPGVGPRTLEKLRASGIAEVATLTKVYREKTAVQPGMESMVQFLRRDVGVRRDHALLISAYAKGRVELEEGGPGEGPDGAAAEAPGADGARGKGASRLTFCVEGNISVGKSTFLRKVAGEIDRLTGQQGLGQLRAEGGPLALHEFVEVVPEPVDKWQDVGAQHKNVLQEFYDNPQKYAYTFQNYVFVTRVMQSLGTRLGREPLRLLERSIFSDRMVFVRAVHEARWMDDVQLSVYDSSFDPYIRHLPGLVPDGFIYLRARPETCHQRLQRRARTEEAGVSLDYLASLHDKHEGWLFPHSPFSAASMNAVEQSLRLHGEAAGGPLRGGQRVLSVGAWPGNLGSTPIPEKLQGRVFGLGAPDLHPAIHNVPALVLDCNGHINFDVTPNEVHWFAEDILAFFDFVKKLKEGQSAPVVQPSVLQPDMRLLREARSSSVLQPWF